MIRNLNEPLIAIQNEKKKEKYIFFYFHVHEPCNIKNKINLMSIPLHLHYIPKPKRVKMNSKMHLKTKLYV